MRYINIAIVTIASGGQLEQVTIPKMVIKQD